MNPRYVALTVMHLACCVGGGLLSNSVSAKQVLPQPSPAVMALARECSPQVHPMTMSYLVAGESTNNPFAINVNHGAQLVRQPRSRDEAQATIYWLDRRGANYDVGLGQVNSNNFRKLGVTGAALLDPCTNLRASQAVLTDCYATAAKTVGQGQAALLRAMSCYNTGSQRRGFENGYVSRFISIAQTYTVPALSGAGIANDTLLPQASKTADSAQEKKKRAAKGYDDGAQPDAGPDIDLGSRPDEGGGAQLESQK